MSSLLLPVLLLAATAATTDSLSVIPGCQALCGGVDIPFPFGIGTRCSRKGFEIDCINNGSAGEIPVLSKIDQIIRVLHLSVSPFPEARVLLPVAWQCFNSTGDVIGSYTGDVNFNPEGVYRISCTRNELFVLGCNTFVYASGVRWHSGRFRYKYYAGCIAVTNDTADPRDGACASLGCCRVDIPPGFTDTTMTMATGGYWSHADQEFCPCDYAFIVEKGNYTFKASDLLSTHIPNNKTMPLHVDWTMPLCLDWAIRDNGSTTDISCAQAPNKPDHDYACRSNHSECIDSTNGPGYFCNCTQGYQGNPYVVGGCTNINECQFPESYYCPSGSKCIDMDGAYKCQCKLFRRGKECHPIIPMSAAALPATFIAAVLGGIAISLLQTRNKKNIFTKNGGKILAGYNITIFTERDIKRITNGYSKRLGRGHFGNVYEGKIDGPQEQKVAVKRSVAKSNVAFPFHWKKMMIRRHEVPEQGQEEDGSFINEIKFQFQNTHNNMVKLLGCCLETETPILVFECVSNGSLHDALHGANKTCTLSPLQRLDIAIGSAEAISFMHSHKHVHGDIKPANILLDENLNPKVSDFGSSKLLSLGTYYARAVPADRSYMDPLYLQTDHFTTECDVYSFGVVLLELITRKTAMYVENIGTTPSPMPLDQTPSHRDEIHPKCLPYEFKQCINDKGSGRTMYDTEIEYSGDYDAQSQRNMQCLDKIAMMALQCLKEQKVQRPTMAKVVEELKEIKESTFFSEKKNGGNNGQRQNIML